MHILGNPPGTSSHSQDGTEGKPHNYSVSNLTQWGHQVKPTIFKKTASAGT